MNEAKIDQYLKHVPIQMMELVENLDSRSKWAVYVALLENKQMYFNQIKDEFGANATEIDRILKSLGAGGLIFKRAKNFTAIKNDNRTYYEPSILGEMFYNSMFNLVIPKKVSTNSEIREKVVQMPLVRQEIPYKMTINLTHGPSYHLNLPGTQGISGLEQQGVLETLAEVR